MGCIRPFGHPVAPAPLRWLSLGSASFAWAALDTSVISALHELALTATRYANPSGPEEPR